ncbi:spindle and centriole-associated protein 1-like [Sinocyclocheilus grahami]|uniref:Spindle and centriole-associated protein 1 n=1 Tax=Sinocyclocheilus grahami TaxID=75366 RepID=A0A672RTC0_SINGR|nr:PREDICTED: spindle and centriole-associated protein 1-like [Sinocyclocheilus grahami]XP_016127238.1 PREDICTED: spindle and centriole-associated protein 1-like [Sinocyclocheilus grahami]XP_016127239.1 PREDICTED: spindle and centriole-associated protein 1-like [Sinocyclocheilus grahami]
MSLVRMNRPLYGAGKRPVRTRKVSAPKKEWVSTVHDLSVHKATPEELAQRHEMHRSQNRVVAQWELKEKALTRRRRKNQPPSPPGLDRARLNIIREVFSDQCQLQDVIARSDRALAKVKDLFRDAPRRRTGFPTITVAPACDSDSELPVHQNSDPPTQLSLLSQSMMDQQALNELEECEEEHEEVQDASVRLSSVMHRKRNKCRSETFPWASDHPEQELPKTPCNTGVREDQAALNATVAVQRLKSRQTHSDVNQSISLVNQVLNPEPASSQPGIKSRSVQASRGRSGHTSGLNNSGLSSLAGNQSSLELLQSMLEHVETELDSLDHQNPLPEARPQQQRPGLTGFSVALVATLGRLASHIRKKEEGALREAQERRRLEEEVKEQRALIDALTVESLTLKEESTTLQARLQQQITDLERRLDAVVLVVGRPDSAESHTTVQITDNTAQKSRNMESGGTEKDLQRQDFVSAAVLLSPPHQRDGLPATACHPHSHAPPLHYSGSYAATASQGSLEDFDISISPSSFASLPRPTPLLDDLSQDAMLGEIAELTRQNATIRAQLGQHRPSPAGASVSREQSADRLSTSSIVRQVSPTTEPQQPISVERSSTMEIEQKLQELNRQSAEARAKLLELIEQQKPRENSLRVSPAISPVPPHSSSTHTVVRGLTPEQFLTLPERNHSPQPSASSRRSTGRLSPQSLGSVEIQSLENQVDKLKREGWFALSAHVK